jgi:hypothetical protein
VYTPQELFGIGTMQNLKGKDNMKKKLQRVGDLLDAVFDKEYEDGIVRGKMI